MTKKAEGQKRSGPKGFWVPITNWDAMSALQRMAALEYRTVNQQAAKLVLDAAIERGFLEGPVDVEGNPLSLPDKAGNDPGRALPRQSGTGTFMNVADPE